jgi:hypothetical protein
LKLYSIRLKKRLLMRDTETHPYCLIHITKLFAEHKIILLR